MNLFRPFEPCNAVQQPVVHVQNSENTNICKYKFIHKVDIEGCFPLSSHHIHFGSRTQHISAKSYHHHREQNGIDFCFDFVIQHSIFFFIMYIVCIHICIQVGQVVIVVLCDVVEKSIQENIFYYIYVSDGCDVCLQWIEYSICLS